MGITSLQSKKNPLLVQQRKVFFLQCLVAVITVLVYKFVQPVSWQPLLYSIFVGFCYQLLLSVGVFVSDNVAKDNPGTGIAILAGAALVRFLVVGVLLIVGMRSWSTYPFAVMLPFILMLIAPIVLLARKKRLTD